MTTAEATMVTAITMELPTSAGLEADLLPTPGEFVSATLETGLMTHTNLNFNLVAAHPWEPSILLKI